jgi:predicted DNA-binding transcriptional regulator AlpA
LAATSRTTREGGSGEIEYRVRRTLEIFSSLPDDALIGIRVVSVLIDRSPASIWRDVAQGRLPRPVRVGARSSRWRVGGVRVAMKGETLELLEGDHRAQ